jgi:hypothetical protein
VGCVGCVDGVGCVGGVGVWGHSLRSTFHRLHLLRLWTPMILNYAANEILPNNKPRNVHCYLCSLASAMLSLYFSQAEFFFSTEARLFPQSSTPQLIQNSLAAFKTDNQVFMLVNSRKLHFCLEKD